LLTEIKYLPKQVKYSFERLTSPPPPPTYAAALAIPRSVPDLSQHASSHALASSFDNLTSYLGADMNMHYMSGQRRHPSLARDAVPLINPHSVMLPSQMRAPGTPKSRQCKHLALHQRIQLGHVHVFFNARNTRKIAHYLGPSACYSATPKQQTVHSD
jgi:hypothetical protein